MERSCAKGPGLVAWRREGSRVTVQCNAMPCSSYECWPPQPMKPAFFPPFATLKRPCSLPRVSVTYCSFPATPYNTSPFLFFSSPTHLYSSFADPLPLSYRLTAQLRHGRNQHFSQTRPPRGRQVQAGKEDRFRFLRYDSSSLSTPPTLTPPTRR